MQCIKAQSYEHSLDKNAVKKDESQFPLHEYRNLWNNNCQHGRVSEVKFMLECPHCDETCATDAIGGNHMQRWHHPPTFSCICNADMQFPICSINTIQFLIYARNSFQSFSRPYSTQLSDSRRFPKLWSKLCYLVLHPVFHFNTSVSRPKGNWQKDIHIKTVITRV